MIRFTCKDEGFTKTVRISGRLEEQHLSKLQTACNTDAETLTLDLSELQSADSTGVGWLHTRAVEGAAIVGASPYIALLLERAARPSWKPSVTTEQ